MMQENFKNRLKDTGFLIKNSFKIIGMDKDIKTPTIRMVLLQLIILAGIFFFIGSFFVEGYFLIAFIVLLFTLLILVPYSFFFNVRQKAMQSWIVFNTITGKDISYKDAKEHIKKDRWNLRKIALVDFIVSHVAKNKRKKGGISAIIVNIFLSALIEIWDLLSHYMIPAVVIEERSLKELVATIKNLRNNVPATLVGVFGIDFVGNVINQIIGQIYFWFIIISLVLGYFLAPYITSTQVYGYQISFIPLLAVLLIISVTSAIIKKIKESIKVIYFTIFYTAIMKPMSIRKDMKSELTNYLLFNKRPQEAGLAGYIRTYLQQGYALAQIKNFLISKGYDRNHVEQAAKQAQK